MNIETNQNLNEKTAVVRQPSRMNGSKFVVVFIIVSALIAGIFCYAMYQAYLTRPKVQIQDEKE